MDPRLLAKGLCTGAFVLRSRRRRKLATSNLGFQVAGRWDCALVLKYLGEAVKSAAIEQSSLDFRLLADGLEHLVLSTQAWASGGDKQA